MNRRINILAEIDWITILIFLGLSLLGWFNVYAAVYNEDIGSIFDPNYRCGKQFIWIMMSLVLGFFTIMIDHRLYKNVGYLAYAGFNVLLIAVLFLGKEVNGARSWFDLGFLRFQPTELAKVATALALCQLYNTFYFKPKQMKWVLNAFAVLLLPTILTTFQPDVGSAIVFLAFIFAMYREGFPGAILFLSLYTIILFVFSLIYEQSTVFFIIGTITLIIYGFSTKNGIQVLKLLLIFMGIYLVSFLLNKFIFTEVFEQHDYIFIGIGITFIVGLYKAVKRKIAQALFPILFFIGSLLFVFSVDYVFNNFLADRHQKRISIVLGLESDPHGVGYNVEQSKIAIGSGGFAGKGYLQGTQTKFKFVPEQTTDFIFCTVGEEWGFIGSFVVISLFIMLLLRLIFLAERQRSRFNRMFGYCIFSVLFVHFTINIGMTIGLVPVIGIPLPFFSYGGSSLWAFTIFLFIFLKLDATRMQDLA